MLTSGKWTKDAPLGSSVTVFNNGLIEAVAPMGVYEKHEKQFLQLNAMERDLVRGLRQMTSLIARFGVPLPFYLCLTLLNVKGYAARYASEDQTGLFFPFRQHNIVLPAIEIFDLTLLPSTTLRPLFDLVWRAFGQDGSPNYDNDGKWSIE